MAASVHVDLWTINIVKLLVHSGGTLPVAEVMDWAKEQCKKSGNKLPSVKTKIKENIGIYFCVSNSQQITKSDVSVVTPVRLCEKYWTTEGCPSHRCGNVHICKYYMLDNCRAKRCKFSHDFQEPINLSVITNNVLAFLSEKELKKLWLKQVNLPAVCKFYNNEGGCNRPQGSPCPAMHLCRFYVMGECKFDPCIRSHDVKDEQVLSLLKNLGWNIDRNPEDITAELQSRFTENSTSRTSTAASQGSNGRGRKSSSSDSVQVSRQAMQQRSAPSLSKTRAASAKQVFPKEKEENEDSAGDSRICTYHLKGACTYGKQCRGVHSKKPYQWQYSDNHKGRESWQRFVEDDNVSIELYYSDVNEDECHAKLGEGNEVAKIDFDKMTYDSLLISGNVRRVGTYSWGEVPITKPFVTKWLWYWKDEHDMWNLYGEKEGQHSRPDVTAREIEEKYIENDELIFQAGIHKYQIDFKAMYQVNVKYGTKRKVRRRPESMAKKPVSPTSEAVAIKPQEVSYPETWDITAISTHTDYQLVEVKSSGSDKKEWDQLVELVQKSLPKATVKKIQRIQNYELWGDYLRQKAKMEKSRKAGNRSVREMQLFHGTRTNYVDPICQQGFDWRLTGTSVGAAYGKGSYFARDAGYSMDYTDGSRLFVVRVLVGDYAKGSASYSRPPPRDPANPHKNLYDSCVNSMDDPKIFVVFERAQSFPEYILEL